MSYIRTNDGRIFDVSNEIIKVEPMPVIDSKEYFEIKLYGVDVRVADTIEELCDEFIMNKKIYSHTWIEKLKNNAKNHANVYAGIWTSKGLVYVAKFNEKGELDLI